jgi:3-methyladenine DNA glycosylase AlkD
MAHSEKIKILFEQHSDPVIAEPMKKYMRNKFEFLGLKTPYRKEITREYFKENGYPARKDLDQEILDLWDFPQREYQYQAMDIMEKFIKKPEKNDIDLIEKLIVSKSWWDTVDYLATRLTGEYFKKFPDQIHKYTGRWVESENIWLKRTALLFQLKYKKNTDTLLLTDYINKCTGTSEFFLNKAIGWTLREYLKTDKDWVLDFVVKHNLSSLSKREALKNVK